MQAIMTQLQLYTTKSQRGNKNLVNINPSDDVLRHIHDFGSALGILRYEPSDLQYFLLLRYIDSGLLLTVLRPIEGDGLDHYAATLYFENGIQISVSETLEIINAVKDFISSGDPDAAGIADMRKLLSKEYVVDKNRPHRQVSSGHHFAFAFYGGHNAPTIEDYANADFYQPEYSDYAGVVLIDSRTVARGVTSAPDVSKPRLEQLVCVNPPAKSPQGFTAHIGRRPFSAPIFARLGSTMTLTWHKSGFETVTVKFKVEGENTTPPIPDTSGSRRVISPTTFYITEERGQQRPVGNYLIRVNGVEIDGPKAFTFADLKNARVEISAPGFMAFTGHYDLASTTQVLVQMHALHKTYRFDLPLTGTGEAEAVRIYIKSKKNLEACPIEGYDIADGKILEGTGVSNALVYRGGGDRNPLLIPTITAVAGLLVGLLIGWLCFHSPAITPVDEPHIEIVPTVTTEAAKETTEQVTEVSLPAMPGADAIAYLDNNSSWHRADMEAIAGLQGLFDDINNYNFEKLAQEWAPKLEASKNFAAIIRATKGAASKRDPRTGAHAPAYDNEGETINWLSYTYWIDP